MIKRKPGWFKKHYFDKWGLSWCGRWRGHGVLKSKPDRDIELCSDCSDRFFRIKKNIAEFKAYLKRTFDNHWS